MPNAHAYDAIMKQVVVGLNVPPEIDNHDASALVAFNVAQSTECDIAKVIQMSDRLVFRSLQWPRLTEVEAFIVAL